jgi:hypothetical protein
MITAGKSWHIPGCILDSRSGQVPLGKGTGLKQKSTIKISMDPESGGESTAMGDGE